MMTFTMRSYRGAADLHPIADLLNACEAVDQEGTFYSVSGLEREFADPNFDPAADLRLWEDTAGRLAAFGQIWVPPQAGEVVDGFLWFRVRPELRDCGMETDVIAWSEARMQQLSQTQGLPAKLSAGCRADQPQRRRLLEEHGFYYERCFLEMTRSLTTPLPPAIAPEGFTCIDATPSFDEQAYDEQAYIDLYNQAFIDHWNFHPMTVDRLRHSRSNSHYRPELDLVAIAADGTYAGFCLCSIDPEDNQHRGCREGWISSLGTRRGFRRQGLARAMLLFGLHRLQQAGMDTALLGVDTENVNQAQVLYEAIGFSKRYANLSYTKYLGLA